MVGRLLLAALGLATIAAGHIVRRRKHLQRANVSLLDDVLVPDAHCGVYLPRSQAIVKRINGVELFFCSKECAKQYQAAKESN